MEECLRGVDKRVKTGSVPTMKLSTTQEAEILERSTEALRQYFTNLKDGTGLVKKLLPKATKEERLEILQQELAEGEKFIYDQVRAIFKQVMKGVVSDMHWYTKYSGMPLGPNNTPVFHEIKREEQEHVKPGPGPTKEFKLVLEDYAKSPHQIAEEMAKKIQKAMQEEFKVV